MLTEEIKAVLRDRLPRSPILAEHSEAGHFYRHVNSDRLLPSVTGIYGPLGKHDHLKAWAAKLAVEHWERNWRVGMSEDEKKLLRKACVLAHQDAFEEAGMVGNFGHDIIEQYLLQWIATGVRPTDIRTFVGHEDSRRWAIARSAEQFCKDHNVTPIASEILVASAKHGFAGTLDSLLMCGIPKEAGAMNCEHLWGRRSLSDPDKVICMKEGCGRKLDMKFTLGDWKSSNTIWGKDEYAAQVSAYAAGLKEMTGLKPEVLLVVRLDKEKAKYEIAIVENPGAALKAFKACLKIHAWKNNGVDKLVPLVKKQIIQI